MSSVRVVTAGALVWELGLEFAIVAVARARATGLDVRYDIVGTGPERDRVLYTAFDLGLENVVRVVPPDPATAARLADADVFLWPDLTGRSSRTAKELGSIGVDVVSTVPGPDVRHVPARDPERLASSLATAASSTSRRRPGATLGAVTVTEILRELGCV